jgi:alkylated DNA repair dioxygenase AlkB
MLAQLAIPDSEVWYDQQVALGLPPEQVFARLLEEVSWQQRTIRLFGREVAQPRLVAWYGDPGCSYTYSGIRWDPSAWTMQLLELRQIVEEVSGCGFNSVLVNLYRDQRDSMGFHSDDEPELGPKPSIASLSVGAERVFVMKHKAGLVRPVRLRLASGSLLVMKGETQRNWKHGIDKQSSPCGPRINLTFRKIVR